MLRSSNRREPRRATVAVLVVILCVVLIPFVAFAVDIGYICTNSAAAQNCADAAALAGALALRSGHWDQAEEWALDCVKRNPTLQGALTLPDQTIELGMWDSETRQFTALTGTAVRAADACRVVITEKRLRLFFGPMLHKPTTLVSCQAIATAGPPCKGIWSYNDASISGGGITGSYDSRIEAYNPLTLGPNGDVCGCQNVKVSGGAIVNGDAEHGSGYGVDQVGSSLITGAIATLQQSPPKPVIDMAAAQANNDDLTIPKNTYDKNMISKDWSVSLSSQNLTLSPGTYYFASLSMSSTSTLTISGPTIIYVAGNISVSGSAKFVTTREPLDLTIFCTGNKVDLTGSCDFFGSLTAPNATVKVSGTGILVGGLVGDSVSLIGGAQLCVDDALPAFLAMSKGSRLVK